jgi:hypothetical protein
MNAGLPIGTATSFPVEAYFKLHYGVPIPPKMFWMLQGVYSSDSGTFTPPIAPMASTNIILSTFNVPTTSGVVNILAIIDADTFRQKPYVIGLGIFEPKTSNINIIKLYPNPAQNILNISSNEFTGINKVNVVVKNLLGKLVMNGELGVANNEATLSLNLAPGIYIVEVVNVKGKSYAQQITIL